MVLNPDPSQLSFIKPFLQTNIEEKQLKKNIVSQMISSVQVPLFTPGSLVQDLRVTQFAHIFISSSAKGPDSDRGRRSGPAISDSKEKV